MTFYLFTETQTRATVDHRMFTITFDTSITTTLPYRGQHQSFTKIMDPEQLDLILSN